MGIDRNLGLVPDHFDTIVSQGLHDCLIHFHSVVAL